MPYVKVKARFFWYGLGNPVSKSFIVWYHHFLTEATFLNDIHIVWYVALTFTNRLSDIRG